jgi:hypothetical protein
VQAVDSMSSEGIMIIALKETYTNTVEEKIEKEKEEVSQQSFNTKAPYIEGFTTVYPYDELVYTIQNMEGGM